MFSLRPHLNTQAQEKQTRRRRLQLLLFVRILVYMFLVQAAGAATIFFQWQWAWITFACGSAVQGIFVALSVTCNCQVLKLYTRTVRTAHHSAGIAMGTPYGSGGTEMAKSASLQLLTWDPVPDPV